jgi:hypothetical protein
VGSAVRSLAPSDQETIYLVYYEDMGIGELAEKWGITRAGVRSRVHRARRRLAPELLRRLSGLSDLDRRTAVNSHSKTCEWAGITGLLRGSGALHELTF